MFNFRKTVDEALQSHNRAVRKVKECKSDLEKAIRERDSSVKAQEIIQLVAQAIQQKVHIRIAEVVTQCIASVYDDPYEFKIHFERKRNKTEARVVFVKDGHELDPTEGVGGGILEVACFALRIVCLSMTHPKPRSLLVVDEPFKAVHGNRNRERLGDLILSLSSEFQIQIILSTGLDWLRIGKVIQL